MRLSELQQEDSTAVLPVVCIKCNIDDVVSLDYMIHDGFMIAM